MQKNHLLKLRRSINRVAEELKNEYDSRGTLKAKLTQVRNYSLSEGKRKIVG